ncbi:LETM1-related biofilm-associated protein [Crocinitomicaceae bacterium]|nr:LETM1-related biofilm-associated protein [Crocinitomicaceae bacterium]
MLAPGSKGWINKYFDLERRNEFSLEFSVPKGLTRKEYVHLRFLRSGIVFGFPVKRIFANELKDSKWTQNEKLKVLLFESLLLIYLMENSEEPLDPEKFKASLLSFYAEHNASGLSKVFGLFMKETPDERLENILSQRLSVKSKLIEGQYWLGYLSNTFVYLDIVLYRNFLKNRKETLSNYNELANNALVAITMAAYSDDIITDQEKAMFKVFLSSANLKDSEERVAKLRFKHGASLADFSEIAKSNVLFRRFLIDITALTIFVNQERLPEEIQFFNEMCDFLDVPKKEVHNAMTMIENFVLQNSSQMSLLSSRSSYEKLYGSVSKRWIKVLSRNSDKLALELKESKELVQLIRKSTSDELSKEEKELVKSQFMDIVKSMPALAIFMLPGGALLLPLILKIIPDLVPSAFRDNELDDEPQ